MKIESRVVAVSWIPSEAVTGAMKAPFGLGLAHYDKPLPEVLGDLLSRPRRRLASPVCLDGDGQPLGSEGGSHSLGGANELGGRRTGTDTDQQSFARCPGT